MRVRELMTSVVHTCRPQDTLEKAARLLWEHDCGCLPVVDAEGRAQSMITDRDICMAAYTRGGRLADLRVADSMSRTLVSCRPDEDLGPAAARMAQHKVRRLPVVDPNGKVQGVLALNDLALSALDDETARNETVKLLAAVCQHRAVVPAAARAASAASTRTSPGQRTGASASAS